MRAIKIIVGIGCFVVALFLGLVGCLSKDLLFLLLFGCWLAGIGWFLIAERHVPMSRKARSLLILNFGLCTGLLVIVGIPNFIKARSTSCCNACINNLRQLDGAKQQWALEYVKSNGVVCTEDDIKPYIKLDTNGSLPKCSQGGKYTFGKVGESPTCSLGETNGGHVLP
jgi:hypothetical protein